MSVVYREKARKPLCMMDAIKLSLILLSVIKSGYCHGVMVEPSPWFDFEGKSGEKREIKISQQTASSQDCLRWPGAPPGSWMCPSACGSQTTPSSPRSPLCPTLWEPIKTLSLMGASMTGQRSSSEWVMRQITNPLSLSRPTRGAGLAPPPCSALAAWPGETPRAVQWVETRESVPAGDSDTGQQRRMSHSRGQWQRPGDKAALRKWAGASWPTTAGATATGCAKRGNSLPRSASRKHHSG